MINRRCIRIVGHLTWALVAALAWCSYASAGTYVMRSCNVPGEAPTATGPWTWSNAAGTFANNDCATGGGFGFNAGPMNRATQAALHLSKPASSAITMRRVRLWLVARLAGTGSALFVDSFVDASGKTSALESIFGPPGGSTLATPYVSPPLPLGTTTYLILLSCSGSTTENCAPSNTNVVDIKGAEITLEESVAPSATIQGGDLMTPAARSGVSTLEYRAVDADSGVHRVAVSMGGVVVGNQDFSIECAHADFAACPRVREGVMQVDTRKLPDGAYPLSLQVTDAAGNVAAEQAATVVQVANGAFAGGPVNVAGGRPRLAVAFARGDRARLTVGYNQRVAVRGKLTSATGAPIAGAVIDVNEQSAIPRSNWVHRTVTTAADGTFTYFVGPRATSRTLKFRLGADSTTERRLRMRVKALSSLRVVLRGVLVRYRGRVLTRPLRRAGTRVEVQGRAPGGDWTTFARRQATARGDFSGTYRLRVHRPGVRLQFRVRVPSQPGYPFVGHAGRSLTRVVR